jgi:hypothetical protein
MGNIFYGLAAALGTALDSGNPAEIEAVLVKNVYGATNPGAVQLAAYLLDESARLAAIPTTELIRAPGVAA